MCVYVLWISGSSDLSPIQGLTAATGPDNLQPEPEPGANTDTEQCALYSHTESVDTHTQVISSDVVVLTGTAVFQHDQTRAEMGFAFAGISLFTEISSHVLLLSCGL